MSTGTFADILGEVTPLLLVVLVMTIVELAKKSFTMRIWQVWILAFSLSSVFIGGGYLALMAPATTVSTVFIALVYTVIGWLASIGAWNVGSRAVDGRLTERAGGGDARAALGRDPGGN